MKRFATLLVCSFTAVVIASAWTAAQSTASIVEGAWAVQDISTPQPSPNLKNPKGLIIFSGRHYSFMVVQNSNRPNLDPAVVNQSGTADQVRAVWGPLAANAGTFTISGATIRTSATVAKNPWVMIPNAYEEYSFKREGDTLVLTRTRDTGGPSPNSQTIRLTRAK
jgi:hypothetical protein